MFKLLGVLSIALGFLTVGTETSRKPVQPTDPTAARGRCPAIYAPVICDGGKTYPNQCVADQHHAKNCVPLGL